MLAQMTSNALSSDSVRPTMLYLHTPALCITITRSHYGNTAPEGREAEKRERSKRWSEEETWQEESE